VEIILVRHALPVRIELETGIADPELSVEGHELRIWQVKT
jgi:hypothetical protein